jgi:hypothetical protein
LSLPYLYQWYTIQKRWNKRHEICMHRFSCGTINENWVRSLSLGIRGQEFWERHFSLPTWYFQLGADTEEKTFLKWIQFWESFYSHRWMSRIYTELRNRAKEYFHLEGISKVSLYRQEIAAHSLTHWPQCRAEPGNLAFLCQVQILLSFLTLWIPSLLLSSLVL